jgi:uncharacterized membrane protein
MKEIYKVEFTIIDKGETYQDQTKEVTVKKGETVKSALQSVLKKYRYAMNLTTKFQFEITTSKLVGYTS